MKSYIVKWQTTFMKQNIINFLDTTYIWWFCDNFWHGILSHLMFIFCIMILSIIMLCFNINAIIIINIITVLSIAFVVFLVAWGFLRKLGRGR